jgi:hypothetical protein
MVDKQEVGTWLSSRLCAEVPAGANSRDTGLGEITPEKSASVFEYVRSCRYAISSECHLMKTELPMS